MTRFTYNEIVRIYDSIGLEGSMSFEGIRITCELSLAILLNRLSFPRRNIDMQYTFGIYKDNISKIVSGLSKLLYEKFKTSIEFEERFSKAISEKEAYFPNDIGFIDGTMQQTRRHKDAGNQKLTYNGWKHIHCVKFQAIGTPDGITSSLFGPYHGSNHGPRIFSSSQMLSRLNITLMSCHPRKILLFMATKHNLSLSTS